MARWPHRVRPLERTVVLHGRRGALTLAYSVGQPEQYIFTVDVYARQDRAHPERHLGWWRFALPPGRGHADVVLDFQPVRRESVAVRTRGGRLPLVDAWWNAEFTFEPLGDIELVMRAPDGTVRTMEPVLLKFMDRDILMAFYARHYQAHGYVPSRDAPFLHELHAYKLRTLRRLFDRYIPPGGRVADVGCGRSLFSEIGVRFPFTIVSGDLDAASVRERAAEVPHHQWGVFDASRLPFRDGSFDALFAGEVIEHVPDARAALREWARVLKPGGVAIVTTPNRARLVARVTRMEQPYSRDHLSELSYTELVRTLVPQAGFDFVRQANIYLELWLRPSPSEVGRVRDHLQREGNVRKNVSLMRRLFPLGRWFPSLATAMIVVARKRA